MNGRTARTLRKEAESYVAWIRSGAGPDFVDRKMPKGRTKQARRTRSTTSRLRYRGLKREYVRLRSGR